MGRSTTHVLAPRSTLAMPATFSGGSSMRTPRSSTTCSVKYRFTLRFDSKQINPLEVSGLVHHNPWRRSILSDCYTFSRTRFLVHGHAIFDLINLRSSRPGRVSKSARSSGDVTTWSPFNRSSSVTQHTAPRIPSRCVNAANTPASISMFFTCIRVQRQSALA